MEDWQSLAHVRWECKYHVVIIPKYRRKVLYGKMRKQVGVILRELCRQKGIELLEGHLMPDHVHMCVSIPPKYSVAHTVGFLKGKSAVRIHRELLQERRMTGLHFWATGYSVSTVGRDEEKIRQYIRDQEKLESGQGDLDLKQRPQRGLPYVNGPLGGAFLKPRPLGVDSYPCIRSYFSSSSGRHISLAEAGPHPALRRAGAGGQNKFLSVWLGYDRTMSQ
jgi:putative transposase